MLSYFFYSNGLYINDIFNLICYYNKYKKTIEDFKNKGYKFYYKYIIQSNNKQLKSIIKKFNYLF